MYNLNHTVLITLTLNLKYDSNCTIHLPLTFNSKVGRNLYLFFYITANTCLVTVKLSQICNITDVFSQFLCAIGLHLWMDFTCSSQTDKMHFILDEFEEDVV